MPVIVWPEASVTVTLDFASLGIQHLLFEFKALVTRCDPGKIAGGRVAGCASARAVEVLLAGLGVSGLQIGDIDSFASALLARAALFCWVWIKATRLAICWLGTIKARHAFVRASIAHDRADLVSIHIGGHELRAREIRPAFSAARVAAMAKRAILPEERASALDESRRV